LILEGDATPPAVKFKIFAQGMVPEEGEISQLAESH
jgi:hypothetical protein